MDTVSALSLPFAEAIDFFRQKTNATSTHWTDVYGAANARAFAVAGAASDALVADFRAAIDKALAAGTTLAEFRADFDRIVSAHGWTYNGARGWRTRIIYETNLSSAYAAGRWHQQTRPETLEAWPFWQYVHSGALHPRKQHQAWNGLTLAATDPFWSTHYPPNGWRCGCRVRVLTERGLARQGKSGPDPAPPVNLRRWTHPKTGVTSLVPDGIDPGFEHNPGESWLRGGPPGGGAGPAGPAAASTGPFRSAVAPPAFVAFVRAALGGELAGRDRFVHIGRLPDSAADATQDLGPRLFAGGREARVEISAETIAAHAHHREATPGAYWSIGRALLEDGAIYLDHWSRIALVGDIDGVLWHMGLKKTFDLRVLVTSLRHTNSRAIARLSERGRLLRAAGGAPEGRN